MRDEVDIRIEAREKQAEAEANQGYSDARTAEEWAAEMDRTAKTFRAMVNDERVPVIDKKPSDGKYRVLLSYLNGSDGWTRWDDAARWARELGVSSRTFVRWAKAGRTPAGQIFRAKEKSRDWQVRQADLDAVKSGHRGSERTR